MEWALMKLFPSKWRTWLNEQEQVQVEQNWLEKEVDQDKIAKMPALDNLSGWRNREVYQYVSGPDSKDWTAGIGR